MQKPPTAPFVLKPNSLDSKTIHSSQHKSPLTHPPICSQYRPVSSGNISKHGDFGTTDTSMKTCKKLCRLQSLPHITPLQKEREKKKTQFLCCKSKTHCFKMASVTTMPQKPSKGKASFKIRHWSMHNTAATPWCGNLQLHV